MSSHFTFPQNRTMTPSEFATAFIPSRIAPFFFLSHPTTLKTTPSGSAYWSRYYVSGPKDILFVLGWGLLCVVLRHIVLVSFERFALKWLLSNAKRDKPRKLKKIPDNIKGGKGTGFSTNGDSNGHIRSRPSRSSSGTSSSEEGTAVIRSNASVTPKMQRIATRFAEQGFAFIYYTGAWLFGLVREDAFTFAESNFDYTFHSG